MTTDRDLLWFPEPPDLEPLKVGDIYETRFTTSVSFRDGQDLDYKPKVETWRVTEIIPTKKTKRGIEFTPPVSGRFHIRGDQAFRVERVKP